MHKSHCRAQGLASPNLSHQLRYSRVKLSPIAVAKSSHIPLSLLHTGILRKTRSGRRPAKEVVWSTVAMTPHTLTGQLFCAGRCLPKGRTLSVASEAHLMRALQPTQYAVLGHAVDLACPHLSEAPFSGQRAPSSYKWRSCRMAGSPARQRPDSRPGCSPTACLTKAACCGHRA